MTMPTADRTAAAQPDRSVSPGRIAALVVALTATLAALMLAFALPGVHSAPHRVPVALVAPTELAGQLEQRLGTDDAFRVTAAGSADDAREAILRREVDGALVVGPESVTALVATAASPSVAQLVQSTAEQLAEGFGVAPTTVDVRGFPADDPRGVGLAAGALPLALGGWMGAAVIMLVVRRTGPQLVATAAFSVLGGVVLTVLLRYVIGTFDGRLLAATAAGVLGIAATAFGILGLRALLGRLGIAIAAIVLVLLGNPLSGLSSSPELLPTPWGAIGQVLPPGATGTLLRNVVFFDGHATARPILVLSAWLVVGLAFVGLRAWLDRRPSRVAHQSLMQPVA